MFAWWTNPTPGIKYLRATLPAGALGGVTLSIDEELTNPANNGDLWRNHPPSTPGIWQLVSNQVRLQAFKEQRLFAPVYLDIDDDYTQMHKEYNAIRWVEFDYETPDLTTSSIETHRHAASFADGVIVTTPYLKTKYDELNDNVYVCRNSVNPDDWPEPLPRDPDEFVIMFAGSPRIDDLQRIRRGMEWAARQPGVKCIMVHDLNMRFKGVRTTGWVDFSNYFNFISALKPDVSLRPIQPHPFARSKSDLKILEAAMAGAFSIVEVMEPYQEWIAADKVLYAASPKDWEKAIKYCVNNRDEITARAAALREEVINTRSIDVVKNDWVKVALQAPQVEDIRCHTPMTAPCGG